MLIKLGRSILGCVSIAIILYVAELAVRDCPSGLFVSDNCLWLWVREQTDLPDDRLLHWLVLFIVGLILLAGIYLTIRYIFPRGGARSAAESE